MLVIGRNLNKQALIGDHSLITVTGLIRDSVDTHKVIGVDLGFETRDPVRRIDTPENLVEAARVKARILRAYQSRGRSALTPPVWVGFRVLEDGQLDLRASLKPEMVDISGYAVAEVNATTQLVPENHEFVVFLTYDSTELKTLRRLIEHGFLNWRFYEEGELEDSSLYGLFVRPVLERAGDVRYANLAG